MAVAALRVYGVAALDGAEDAAVAGTALVPFRDIAAVVRECQTLHPSAKEDFPDYRRVIETVFAHQTVLPAPVGLIFRPRDRNMSARESVAKWLEVHYVTLSEALAFLDGRVAARVHVMLDEMAAIAPGETAEVVSDIDAIAAGSFRVLRRHAVASVNVRAPRATAPLAATASFLLEREHWQVFADVVREEDKRAADLRFELTGPWPPYDFVKMQFTG